MPVVAVEGRRDGDAGLEQLVCLQHLLFLSLEVLYYMHMPLSLFARYVYMLYREREMRYRRRPFPRGINYV